MHVKSTICTILAIALLSGCAHQQDQQSTRIDADAAIASANDRCDQSVKDPRIDPIRGYIPITNPESATIPQLASKKKPNASEKEAILVWDSILSTCVQDHISVYQAIGAPANYINNFQTLASAQKQAKARLWSGQISYGEYLRISTENRSKSAERSQKILEGMQADELQRAQLAAQQSQAAAQALMLFNQAAQPYRRPVQTNCVRIGGQTNCTTY